MESKQSHGDYGEISLDLRLSIGREEEAPYACSYCNRRFFSKLPPHGCGLITLDLRLSIGREEDAAYACSCCNGKFLSKQPLGSHQNTHELEGTAGTRKRRLDWAGAWDHDGEIAAAAPEVDLSLKL
jgi:DNA-directed RNA polymerase subunit RPC12/RpoP